MRPQNDYPKKRDLIASRSWRRHIARYLVSRDISGNLINTTMHNGQRRGCLCACLGHFPFSAFWVVTDIIFSGTAKFLLGISAILITELYVSVHPGDNNLRTACLELGKEWRRRPVSIGISIFQIYTFLSLPLYSVLFKTSIDTKITHESHIQGKPSWASYVYSR